MGDFLGRSQFLRQASHLRLRAGRGDDELGAPAREQRVHVGHVEPVAERRIRRRQGSGLLADRLGFAGQCRFVDLEPCGENKPPVGRHAVARLQQHDVARHQVVGSDLVLLALAPHAGLDGQHRLQGGQAPLGAVLLVEADDAH